MMNGIYFRVSKQYFKIITIDRKSLSFKTPQITILITVFCINTIIQIVNPIAILKMVASNEF